MHALHGVNLSLDARSAYALRSWLSVGEQPGEGPTVEAHFDAPGTRKSPDIVEVISEEPEIWLGRTATGLIVGDRAQSWLTVDAAGAIDGVLASTTGRAPPQVLLAALLIALRIEGVHSLHAAVLCIHDRALVLVGDSGSGKSTTATALASAGCSYLGDDGVLLRERSGNVELLAYWPSFRLTDQVLPSFAALRPFLSKLPTDNKWQLDASAAFPGRYLRRWRGPITLFFLARSAQQDSTVAPMTLTEATGLLIAQSSSLCLDWHPNPRQHLELVARLARRARLTRLELGTEWLEDSAGAARRLMQWASLPPQDFIGEAS